MRLICIILVIALLAACQPGQAIPTPTATPQYGRVFVQPATLRLSVGQSTRVSVQIENVKNLTGVELYLKYNPDQLEIQDEDSNTPDVQVELGGLLSTDMVALNQVEPGVLKAAYLQIPPTQPVTGSGQLVAFSVIGRAPGQSSLSLETVNLADSTGMPILTYIEHAQITVE